MNEQTLRTSRWTVSGDSQRLTHRRRTLALQPRANKYWAVLLSLSFQQVLDSRRAYPATQRKGEYKVTSSWACSLTDWIRRAVVWKQPPESQNANQDTRYFIPPQTAGQAASSRHVLAVCVCARSNTLLVTAFLSLLRIWVTLRDGFTEKWSPQRSKILQKFHNGDCPMCSHKALPPHPRAANRL